MSRRSKRRSRRQRAKKKVSVPALMQKGKTAFKQEDYNTAIKTLEQAYRRPNAPAVARAALAEAYFRRALTTPANPTTIIDLKHAAQLAPKNTLYRYHLALAQHREGHLEQAISVYRDLLARTPPFLRAAFPLGQALIQQKKTLGKDPVWKLLSDAEKTQLFAAEALIKNKAASTLRRQLDKPLPALWRGLLAFKLKDYTLAKEQLQLAADDAQLPPAARGAALTYLGALDANAKQYSAALKRWKTAQSYGAPAQIEAPMMRLAYAEAERLQRAGHPQKAAQLLEEYAGEYTSMDSPLMQRLNLDLAYQAARKGNWNSALLRWEAARDSGDNSRALLFNLALAYQHTDQHWEAAETWRSVLRRRPRKADHPDALSDEQVARIWQRVAENYNRAGDYEEAIKTYKTAVKKSPENIALRLKLVEAYQEEGRWLAADNEIRRILNKDPDYVPALMLLAESQSNDWNQEIARSTWRHILNIDPKNPVARQRLAHSYVEEAERARRWAGLFGRDTGSDAAIGICKAGLKELPNSLPLLVLLGKIYAARKEFEQANNYFERALAQNPNDLNTLHDIYIIWLNVDHAANRQALLTRIKAAQPAPPGNFYLSLFKACLDNDYLKEAERHLEYVVDTYNNNESLLVNAAHGYFLLKKNEKLVAILTDILERNPDNFEANLHLGLYYHEQGNARLAKQHINKAEAQARKENDQTKLYQVKILKDEAVYGKKLPSNPVDILLSMPPELRNELLKDAPPEVLNMLKNNPEILKMLMGDFDDDDEYDIFDEDEFFEDDDYFF